MAFQANNFSLRARGRMFVANVMPFMRRSATWINFLRSEDPKKQYAGLVALNRLKTQFDHPLIDTHLRRQISQTVFIGLICHDDPSVSLYAIKLLYKVDYRLAWLTDRLEASLQNKLANTTLESLKHLPPASRLKKKKTWLLSQLNSYTNWVPVIRSVILRQSMIPTLLADLADTDREHRADVLELFIDCLLEVNSYCQEMQVALQSNDAIKILIGLTNAPYCSFLARSCLSHIVHANSRFQNELFELWGKEGIIADVKAHSLRGNVVEGLIAKNPRMQNVMREIGLIPVVLKKFKATDTGYDIGHGAKLLKALVENNYENQNTFRELGGIPELLKRVDYGIVDNKDFVVEALAALAQNNPENQHLIRLCNGIEKLICAGTDPYFHSKAYAVSMLVDNNFENQEAFRRAGGISKLVGLLTCCNFAELVYSTLLSLSKNNENNIKEIRSAISQFANSQDIRSNPARLAIVRLYESRFLQDRPLASRLEIDPEPVPANFAMAFNVQCTSAETPGSCLDPR
ncbi:MAG: hypothetical protein K0R66_914 [Gammaproteobacteria bacterium]|jgi:hypothetical protein|nr:hypothetical protein [Gammaproteobacteria bacterium]